MLPIKDKVIKDDTRITLCLPFINRLIEKKAKIIATLGPAIYSANKLKKTCRS